MSENNYTAKFGIDASEFKKELSLINANLKNLKAQVKLNAISNADYEKSINTLNDVIEENVKKEKALSNELERLRKNSPQDLKAITDKSTALKNQQTATFQARKALDDFKESNNKARKETDIHTVKIDMLSHAIYDLAKALTEKACKALVDFTKETINTGMQFESAFAGVRKVTSGTEEDFKNLESEIRKTALEKPISADQLASIYQMGSQLGIAKDGLKDFSNAIIDLAKTSDLTEEAGATMIAQYANVTGLKEDEYRKFASTLSYLGSTTATTESTIMDFASRISGSAKLIGMSHQEILALSTALGSVGIKAEMGGSAISKIMNSIDVAVDKNSKDLQTWAQVAGVSSSEFANKWKTNVSGAFQDVLTGMTKFKDEGGSLNILLEELDIKNIRQTETLKKLANASELLAEDMSKANEEWEKATFLGESAGQMYDTLEAKTQLLQNSFNELRLSIYDDLKEPLKDAAEELSNFFKSDDAKKFAKDFADVMKNVVLMITSLLKGLIKNFDKVIAIIKLATSILAGFITAKVINGVASLINNIKSFAVSLVNLVHQLLSATSAQNALNIAMASNPIGMVATMIGVLATGLVAFALNSNSATDAAKEHTKALEEQRDQLIANREEREKTIAGIESESQRTQEYVEKLKSLVDENGRVIGSKEELNKAIAMIKDATGVEIKIVDDQIVKYKELIGTLEQVIAKKRMEAKINAYQGDYEKAWKIKDENEKELKDIKRQESLLKEYEEIRNSDDFDIYNPGSRIEEIQNELGVDIWNPRLQVDLVNKLKKREKAIEDSEREIKDTIDHYEGLIAENFEKFGMKEAAADTKDELLKQKKELESTLKDFQTALQKGSSNVAYKDVETAQNKLNEVERKLKELNNFANGVGSGGGSAGGSGSGGSSGGKKSSSTKTTKEETSTSYQELLNQEKVYETQLQNYLTAIKQGNSQITVEMVEDTKKKLDTVQKKVKEMKQLLGESTSTTTLRLPDESYGTLEKKHKELKAQYSQMMSDLANGNKNITEDMLKNVKLQVDQVEAKIKNLKNKWNESGEDGEISDEFESENTNHVSKGVIFGKGVLGENAVEMEGTGKDAAAAYLDAYEAEKERRNNELVVQAKNQAQQEALSYQEATVDPNNLAVYDITEKQLAESKQTSQAQGLTDNAYKVIDAETWTLNQAINAAMQIDFTQIGKYMCDGIANGIRENAHVVIGAVRAMMAEANSTAADEEEEHSPSKVFYRFGKFMDLGMANGIRDYAKLVSNQVREMTSRANEAISLANNQISAERFGNVNALRGAGNTEINYNFTQNNTSNKSLDTLAIYQESKSMLKRVVRNQYV